MRSHSGRKITEEKENEIRRVKLLKCFDISPVMPYFARDRTGKKLG
jgi:hypothetical protein